LRSVMIDLPGDHDAQPYTSSRSGSPPIQCVSRSTSAFSRDQFADSASTSQSRSLSSDGVMYSSCSSVPVAKYECTSFAKSWPGSVLSLRFSFA